MDTFLCLTMLEKKEKNGSKSFDYVFFVSALKNGLLFLSFRWDVISCSIAYRNICFQLKSAKIKLRPCFCCASTMANAHE